MTTRPNILLFIADQHRADFLQTSATPDPALPVRTPNLHALASQGARFTNAYTPSPLCAPARACLASGKHYDHTNVPDNQHDYPLTQATYYQQLRAHNYTVCGVGKFDLHKATQNWHTNGSRHLKEWGFTNGVDNEGKLDAVNSGATTPKGPYMAYLHKHNLAQQHVTDFQKRSNHTGTHPTPLPEHAYCDNWIANNGLTYLRHFPKNQPWHLIINFTGPHDPLDVTKTMQTRWQHTRFPQPHNNQQPDINHQAVRQNYAAMIENIDTHIGRYVQLMQERGEQNNTIIIYTSDHGDMLGDHNHWGKKTYYQPSVRIPLIINGPNIPAQTNHALTSLHDLNATILDYAQLELLPDTDAKSLRPLLEGACSTHRQVIMSALAPWRMTFDGRYKLVEHEGVPSLLFDLKDDPYEDVNIIMNNETHVSRLQSLRYEHHQL